MGQAQSTAVGGETLEQCLARLKKLAVQYVEKNLSSQCIAFCSFRFVLFCLISYYFSFFH